jgi:hypothetical protein
MDKSFIAAGVGFWFGFSMALFISVLAHSIHNLLPLSKAGGKYGFFSFALRIAVIALGMFGIFGFAAFQGQLSPSRNLSAIFLLLGVVIYYGVLFFYRRLAARVTVKTPNL